MSPAPQKPPEQTKLLVQPGAGLARLAQGGSPVLTEIISRSHVQIQSGKALAEKSRAFQQLPGNLN